MAKKSDTKKQSLSEAKESLREAQEKYELNKTKENLKLKRQAAAAVRALTYGRAVS